jgi:hypothetical protein
MIHRYVKCAALIFGMDVPEDGGSMVLRIVCTYLVPEDYNLSLLEFIVAHTVQNFSDFHGMRCLLPFFKTARH